MPRKYSDEAIALCAQLYLKFNGQQLDRLEAEMRQQFPGWSKQNLHSRGKGANLKIGWIEKFGWEAMLKLKISTSARQAATSAEKLFLEIEQIRERLKETLDAQGGTDRDLIYQHRDYCKLTIDALVRLAQARDNVEMFVAMYERLLEWLGELSAPALSELLKVGNAITERARKHYALA
jgi:hypothetical protein